MAANRGSVLIVDDDLAVRVTVRELLKRAGYEAVAVESGEEAIQIVSGRRFDVALIDLVMPGMNGIELMGVLRQTDPDLILIMLTARSTVDSAIEALRIGAHDYLRKPCKDEELKRVIDEGIAKRDKEVRRRELVTQLSEIISDEERPPAAPPPGIPLAPTGATGAIQAGALVIDPGRRTVTLAGHVLDLTPMEFSILHVLAQHQGQVMTGREIVCEVQGYDCDEYEAREIVRYHIHGLRKKLGDHADCVRTVHGVGYRFEAEEG
jgi:DNA-binding response OmpR family regulator